MTELASTQIELDAEFDSESNDDTLGADLRLNKCGNIGLKSERYVYCKK